MKTKLFNLFVLIIGGLIIFNLASNILRFWQKRGGLREEQQKLEELKVQGSRFKAELEYVQSPEFAEKEAREKLGWAKEGEEVWVLPPINVNQPEIEENPDIPNWRKWLELFYPIEKHL